MHPNIAIGKTEKPSHLPHCYLTKLLQAPQYQEILLQSLKQDQYEFHKLFVPLSTMCFQNNYLPPSPHKTSLLIGVRPSFK